MTGTVKFSLTDDNGSVKPPYRGHRFPPEIISHAVCLYHRFSLSLRDVEDLLAERGVTVSYEAIRLWRREFGPAYARALRRRRGRHGDIRQLSPNQGDCGMEARAGIEPANKSFAGLFPDEYILLIINDLYEL